MNWIIYERESKRHKWQLMTMTDSQEHVDFMLALGKEEAKGKGWVHYEQHLGTFDGSPQPWTLSPRHQWEDTTPDGL